jgi:hypothetical protein
VVLLAMQTPFHSLVDGPFVYQVPQPLLVGQRVSAVHPRTKELLQGSILTVEIAKSVCSVVTHP